jgi:hypothetical protein
MLKALPREVGSGDAKLIIRAADGLAELGWIVTQCRHFQCLLLS